MNLEHFVVLREQAAAAIDQADMIVAVGLVGGARPAFKREEQDIDIRPATARIGASEGEAEQPVPAGRDHLRDRLGEGAENRIRGRTGERIAEGRGGRKAGV